MKIGCIIREIIITKTKPFLEIGRNKKSELNSVIKLDLLTPQHTYSCGIPKLSIPLISLENLGQN